MSFIRADINLRTPTIPGMSIGSTVYFGSGDDKDLVVFDPGNTSFGKAIMTQGVWAYSLKIGEIEYQPVFADVNGYIYWEYHSDYIYRSRSYGWVKCDVFPGYEPSEIYDSDTREYTGDYFYAGDLPTASVGAVSSFSPRGAERERGTNISISVVFPRWVSSVGFFGEYEGKDGARDIRSMGLPAFSCDGVTFVKSLRKSNGKHTYGDIHYEYGVWVIGVLDSADGWWEGSEPEIDSSVIFKFCKPKDSEVTGKDKTVTFSGYVEGDNTQDVYYGDVAKWM